MNTSASYGQIASLLRDCCVEMAVALAPGDRDSLGLVSAQESDVGPQKVASFLDLGGMATLRATLATSASISFLRGTHPRRSRGVTHEDLVGWASELLNQLAGRLVNKLGRRGVALQIGIPGSLMGREIQLWFPFQDSAVFEGEGLQVFFSLEELPTNFDVPLEEHGGVSQEGDLLLF